MAFALPAIAHAGNLMTQEILPSDTDPAITRFNEPNVIVFDEEGLDPNNVFSPDDQLPAVPPLFGIPSLNPWWWFLFSAPAQ